MVGGGQGTTPYQVKPGTLPPSGESLIGVFFYRFPHFFPLEDPNFQEEVDLEEERRR